MAKTIDNAVMDLLKIVQKKKDEIVAAKKKPGWKTNLSIGYDPDSTKDRTNIMTVKKIDKVVELYAFLLSKQEFINQAKFALDLEKRHAASSYMGYPISDWLEDLKSRAAQLGVEQKQKEMAALDARVNKLVSPDQRREMELEALQEMLK